MRIVYTVCPSLLRTYVLGFDACLVSSSISKTGLSTKLIATVCVTLPADAIEVPKSIDGLLVRLFASPDTRRILLALKGKTTTA